MREECALLGIGTAVPAYEYSSDDIRRVGDLWLQNEPEKHQLFERFLSSSKTDRRFFAIPAEEILQLNGLHGRQAIFEREGPILGELAVTRALREARKHAADIDTLLFTSCSCPPIPSIDARIIEQAGLSRTVNRIPIYQHGCAGGVAGLGLASQLVKAGQLVALNSVELCSLVFHSSNPTPAELVGSALFADGAACAVLGSADRGLLFRGHQSYLIPDTRHLMGYETLDDGFHLRLDRGLPAALIKILPSRVDEFLGRTGTCAAEISHWLFHPGGIKILDFLEDAFKLRAEQASWSREVLRDYGNLSSATVLFVLDRFLKSKIVRHGDLSLMVGIGPGLTIELILFEYRAE